MYTVTVRDHVMIAHSFRGDVFGPAQRLHGATFIVDVELRRPELSEDNIVVDIGRATEALHGALAEINYRNLDEVEAFSGQNTTTEFIARWVFERMKDAIAAGGFGLGAEGITGIKVTLGESHVAWAAYEGSLP